MTTTLLNNRYQVIQVLGAGGFGETFLAEDTHLPSRRRCVIKQLKPISNDPQTYQLIQKRFEREAATLEFLGEGSDQIPKLYAYFSEAGQFYLVQEWIQGKTLSSIIQSQGKESEANVRNMLLSLLSVLDYVHSKGIIHRDIKPDNIILRSPDQKPVLIDFGAVKETIRTVVSVGGIPTQSLVIGTPGYMPSEQAIGRPVYATDIYSLGLTAIYLLTGQHPQELETNPQTGEIIWLPSAPHVSPELAMILNRAIAIRIGDRYSTASQMLNDLETASVNTYSNTTISLNPSPDTAQPTQPLYPVNTPIIKASLLQSIWQKPTVIIGSVVAGSVIGTLVISNLTRPPQSTTSIATNQATPTPENTVTSTNPPVINQSQPIEVTSPQQIPPQNNTAPLPDANSSEAFTAVTPEESVTQNLPNPAATPSLPADTQTEIVPTSPEVAPPVGVLPSEIPPSTGLSTPSQQQLGQQKKQLPNLATNIRQPRVPAFPTGTSRTEIEAVLGKPRRDLRGLWRNTRAVTYKLVPNKIDLGYLFDRDSGTLRQTEVAFAQDVNPQVMQNTLNGLLNGQATAEIQQGLQQIQQRQTDNFQFSQGTIKGQIVRQNCDFIYISIWDADLHDFVNPADAKRC
ncbi:MAG TPA: protein kinase [Nostocaceae cyanobacterium]|nr:protein kinase [Nostocaceae cyanobacterium]